MRPMQLNGVCCTITLVVIGVGEVVTWVQTGLLTAGGPNSEEGEYHSVYTLFSNKFAWRVVNPVMVTGNGLLFRIAKVI